MHGQCTELALAPLSAVDVAAYLAGRFPTLQTPTGLARVLRRRTAGNPLFMGLVVQEWVVQGLLVQREGRWSVEKPIGQMAESIPDSILRVIAKQSERLSAEEQHLLAAASVVGVEFSAAAVAATLDGDVVEIEARLEGLA
jgi:predicted ATPase